MKTTSKRRVSRDLFHCYRCRRYRRGKPAIVMGENKLCRECKSNEGVR